MVVGDSEGTPKLDWGGSGSLRSAVDPGTLRREGEPYHLPSDNPVEQAEDGRGEQTD